MDIGKFMNKKFRAWCHRKKQWADEVEIFYDGSYIMRFPNEDLAIERNVLPNPEDCLVQFTGLYDKDGKEIFEGHILQVNLCKTASLIKNGIVENVVYLDHNNVNKHVGYIVSYDLTFSTLADVAEYSQIIGNIYENPYLLEEKE